MSEKKIKYTVSIYTENSVGLLNRISAIFQKRHINIESFNSSITEIEDIHRWTILVHTSETLIKKIVGQINEKYVHNFSSIINLQKIPNSDTYVYRCVIARAAHRLLFS